MERVLSECFTGDVDFTWRVSDCEELVGEGNHITECVTDLFKVEKNLSYKSIPVS